MSAVPVATLVAPTGPALSNLAIVPVIGLTIFLFEAVLTWLLKPALVRLLRASNKALTEHKAQGVAQQAVMRVTGSVHNFIQVGVGLAVLLDPQFRAHPLFMTSRLSWFMVQLSAGYFLHDLAMCVVHYHLEGPAYLMHAAVCFVAYAYGTYSGLLHYFGAGALMWEISTPFVQFRWFLYKLGMDHTKLYIANGLAMIAAFFACRIVWGYVFTVHLVTSVWREHLAPAHAKSQVLHGTMPLPVAVVWIYTAAAVLMDSLNTYWFVKMADRAARVVFGGQASSEINKEKDE